MGHVTACVYLYSSVSMTSFKWPELRCGLFVCIHVFLVFLVEADGVSGPGDIMKCSFGIVGGDVSLR